MSNGIWVLILLSGGFYSDGEERYEEAGLRINNLATAQQCRAIGDAFTAAREQPYAAYVCVPQMVLDTISAPKSD